MKRKKAAAFITAIVMCMSMAYSPQNYNNYSIVYAEGTETEYTPVDFDSETGTITRCWSMDDVINIPPVIDGTVVISIDSMAFGGRAMKEIYLPETITSIGSHAFSGCKNLERIDVPYCTENIGSMAFKDCISLKTVNLPDNLISISNNMFTGCSSLEEIIIPDKVKIIEFDAFKGCTALKNVMFPDGLECIRNSAFEGCESIEELVIPVNVFDFGYNAFEGTRWFENKRNEGTDIVINGVLLETKNDEKTIVIPDGITGIGGGALANKGRTSSICLPDSVTYICDKAFYSCGRLKTVELSDNITYIGASAFEGCHNLEEMKLPEKLTTIGNRAFFNCDTITNMTIPASVTEIGDYSIGYVSNGTRINGFTIKGYSGSAAERYAKFTFDFIEIEGETTNGDANCDGNVNMADAVLIMQSLANPDKYGVNGTDETHITAQGEKNGDMDGNGLTNADALEIQKMLLKLS